MVAIYLEENNREKIILVTAVIFVFDVFVLIFVQKVRSDLLVNGIVFGKNPICIVEPVSENSVEKIGSVNDVFRI